MSSTLHGVYVWDKAASAPLIWFPAHASPPAADVPSSDVRQSHYATSAASLSHSACSRASPACTRARSRASRALRPCVLCLASWRPARASPTGPLDCPVGCPCLISVPSLPRSCVPVADSALSSPWLARSAAPAVAAVAAVAASCVARAAAASAPVPCAAPSRSNVWPHMQQPVEMHSHLTLCGCHHALMSREVSMASAPQAHSAAGSANGYLLLCQRTKTWAAPPVLLLAQTSTWKCQQRACAALSPAHPCLPACKHCL